jgi:hypothetical protein
MRRFVNPKAWLNDTELTRLGGTFAGTIKSVAEQEVRNRFTGEDEKQPVIRFADGHRLVPNLTMRQTLIALFGHETSGWHGRRVQVFRRAVECVDKKTGVVKTQHVKAIGCADVDLVADAHSAHVNGAAVRTPDVAEIFGHAGPRK